MKWIQFVCKSRSISHSLCNVSDTDLRQRIWNYCSCQFVLMNTFVSFVLDIHITQAKEDGPQLPAISDVWRFWDNSMSSSKFRFIPASMYRWHSITFLISITENIMEMAKALGTKKINWEMNARLHSLALNECIVYCIVKRIIDYWWE